VQQGALERWNRGRWCSRGRWKDGIKAGGAAVCFGDMEKRRVVQQRMKRRWNRGRWCSRAFKVDQIRRHGAAGD